MDQAADADTSESQVEDASDPQTPKPMEKTDEQRHKEEEKAKRELRRQEEAREGQRKKEEKEKQKKPKEDERANRKRKEEEDIFATAAAMASPSQKKGAVEGSPCHPATGWLFQEQQQQQRQVTGGPTYRRIMTVAGPYRTYNQ